MVGNFESPEMKKKSANFSSSRPIESTNGISLYVYGYIGIARYYV